MAEIDPYIRTLFFQKYSKLGMSGSPMRRAEMLPTLTEGVNALLVELGFPNVTDTTMLCERLLDELVEGGVIHRESLQFAGEYLTFLIDKYPKYRSDVLSTDAIYGYSQRIGPRFFPEVLTGYASSFGEQIAEFPTLGLAPASSRIVTFSDNQITDFDDQTSKIIDAVSAQNQIGGVVGVREILLGQLKAGRELIRAGSFRVYLLQLTLIQSLRYLAEHYEKELIGGLAAALITALVKQIGIDA